MLSWKDIRSAILDKPCRLLQDTQEVQNCELQADAGFWRLKIADLWDADFISNHAVNRLIS